MLDHFGADGGASNGVSLDEGDSITDNKMNLGHYFLLPGSGCMGPLGGDSDRRQESVPVRQRESL